MAIAAFTGNILVIVVNHCMKDRQMSKTTGLVFSNLAITDFLMSIYLFIISQLAILFIAIDTHYSLKNGFVDQHVLWLLF